MTQRNTYYYAAGTVALAAGFGAYMFYRVRGAHAAYPSRPAAAYHLTPAASRLGLKLPPTLDTPGYLYATIPAPLPGGKIAADPAKAFTEAMFAHPYFYAEDLAFRAIGYHSKPRDEGFNTAEITDSLGPSYVGGLFTTIAQSPESVLLWWSTPASWIKGRKAAVSGGTQELSAVVTDTGLEVAYGTAHATLGDPIEQKSLDMLEYDRAYLFDCAVKRMTKWVKAERK